MCPVLFVVNKTHQIITLCTSVRNSDVFYRTLLLVLPDPASLACMHVLKIHSSFTITVAIKNKNYFSYENKLIVVLIIAKIFKNDCVNQNISRAIRFPDLKYVHLEVTIKYIADTKLKRLIIEHFRASILK